MAPNVDKSQIEKGMSKVNQLLFWMKVVVFLDFFGVALVVPLLTSYFRDAGINTKLLGVMSSLYSVSQIFGGIVMGILSDTQSKHDVLMLSLLGSAVSYFIVGSSQSVTMLFLSRILVGLVKQTYTIATTVINEITDNNPELRSQELGRLSAISTVSFIIGPSVGSILYSSMSKDAPAKAASLCFVLNAAVCIIFIPRTGIMAASSRKVKQIADEDTNKKSSSFTRFLSKPCNIFRSQLTDLAGIQNVLPVILMRLSIIFVESSMSSRNIVNYYENRFGIPTSALGFMQTATSGPSFRCILSLTNFRSSFAH
jgi:MFS family permease